MSNKTLKVVGGRIKSAPKRLFVVLTLGLIVFGAVWLYMVRQPEVFSNWPAERVVVGNDNRCLTKAGENPRRSACLANLEVADTDAKRIKGLSDRDALGEGRGMLFISDVAETQCFWMKDMRFSIDMIWLDDQKKVQKIVPSVSPDSYPSQFCHEQPSLYVLELNSGQSAKMGITVGETLIF